MALQFDTSILQGPIPGMSLTQEPGNMPWENPPELSDIYDVMEFYLDRILNVETENLILYILDEGVSIETIAQYLTTSGTMNGRHSLDLAFLVNPYVREIIRYIADSANVEYIDSYADREKKKRLPYREVRKIVKNIFENEIKPIEKTEEEKDDFISENIKTGLMARKNIKDI